MSNKRRREHDVDEETEERKTTTLDILDDHPFLSKQIQASVNLRNTPIYSDFIKHYHNNRNGLLELLIGFIRGNVQRYLSKELDFNVFQHNGKTCFNIADYGAFPYLEWSIKRSNEIITSSDINDPEEIIKNNQRNIEWRNLNPPPEGYETDYFSKIDVYNDEISRFLKRFQNILSENGIEFEFEEDYDHDGITRIISIN